jgi:hypothetical protein
MAGPACGHKPGSPEATAGDLSARQSRVPGQYLVTLGPGADVKVIAAVFGRFGIRDIRDLGQDVYLMILTEDPGPAVLEELRGRDAHLKAIQPNFIYQTKKPGDAQ